MLSRPYPPRLGLVFGALFLLACVGPEADEPKEPGLTEGSAGDGAGGEAHRGTGGVTSVIQIDGGAGEPPVGHECLTEDPPDWCDEGMFVTSGPACGDGELNPDSEACDDGNSLPGDGCNGLCEVEANFECPTVGQPCESTIVCGDGELAGSELCDDGNTDDGDGCAADCQAIEPYYYCPAPGEACEAIIDPCALADPPPSCTPAPIEAKPACGDGNIDTDTGEECDDGNSLPGDGCSGACTLEPHFICPIGGQPCHSTIVCGDGERTGDEACDDDNIASGDGCDENCRIEPGYYCPSEGQACLPLTDCGDGRTQAGETCDDGNEQAGDGCDESCRVESGYRCIRPGIPCEPIPVCGDGTLALSAGEQCDDGNTDGGDGCSAECRIEASHYDCSTPGQLCEDTLQCGDGNVEGDELCDDGNLIDGDGCTSSCTVESGWVCRVPGGRCLPDCGDALIVAGAEECDDGNGVSGDGCSSTCQLEPGWQCPTAGEPCTQTVCGDGVLEGTEICDLGASNGLYYGDGRGCTRSCTPEPTCRSDCTTHACTSLCGDGVRLGSEVCDDGNLIDGDGCSSACTVEPGFSCSPLLYSATSPCPYGECLMVRVIYRDFRGEQDPTGHPDFLHYGYGTPQTTCIPNASGGSGIDGVERCYGLAADTLDCDGKPAWSGKSDCYCEFTDSWGTSWGSNSGNVTMIHGDEGFRQWFRDTLDVNVQMQSTLRLVPLGGGEYQFDSDAFFPVDGLTEDKICDVSPYWTQSYPCPDGGHNYYFTSEARYLFLYQSTSSLTVSFYGDDDAWIFVNGRLAIDLGATHDPLGETITIDSSTAATFGLSPDNVYELAIFHAQRAPIDSHYQLTLSESQFERSDCLPSCGDGMVTAFEECDEGAANDDDAYGGCRTDCTFGPYCGDGIVQPADEDCDDGQNTAVGYGASGCGPGCRYPPRCGDGWLDAQEECDQGDAGNLGGYGGCNPDCTLAPFCGDGEANDPSEECDDGLNIGGYEQCGPGCVRAERCGDGTVQSEYGEDCDDGNDITGDGCTNCGFEGWCGDGIVDDSLGETCDDGVNDGSYGHCTADCQAGPHCGDGVPQSPDEECDDGVNDGGYGECATGCRIDEYCGDGIIQTEAGEECDDGVNDGFVSDCAPGCVLGPHCGDAIVQADRGEECDDGVNNSPYGGGCAPGCVLSPSCGDGAVDTAFGEQCDDGLNEGGYGECAAGCRYGPRCGDGEVQVTYDEQCDEGEGGNDGGYGECAPGCVLGPHCGDSVVQPAHEECDDGNHDNRDGCSAACLEEVWIPR